VAVYRKPDAEPICTKPCFSIDTGQLGLLDLFLRLFQILLLPFKIFQLLFSLLQLVQLRVFFYFGHIKSSFRTDGPGFLQAHILSSR